MQVGKRMLSNVYCKTLHAERRMLKQVGKRVLSNVYCLVSKSTTPGTQRRIYFPRWCVQIVFFAWPPPTTISGKEFDYFAVDIDIFLDIIVAVASLISSILVFPHFSLAVKSQWIRSVATA